MCLSKSLPSFGLAVLLAACLSSSVAHAGVLTFSINQPSVLEGDTAQFNMQIFWTGTVPTVTEVVQLDSLQWDHIAPIRTGEPEENFFPTGNLMPLDENGMPIQLATTFGNTVQLPNPINFSVTTGPLEAPTPTDQGSGTYTYNLVLSYSFPGTSIKNTQNVPATLTIYDLPEPASLTLAIGGAVTLAAASWQRRRWKAVLRDQS